MQLHRDIVMWRTVICTACSLLCVRMATPLPPVCILCSSTLVRSENRRKLHILASYNIRLETCCYPLEVLLTHPFLLQIAWLLPLASDVALEIAACTDTKGTSHQHNSSCFMEIKPKLDYYFMKSILPEVLTRRLQYLHQIFTSGWPTPSCNPKTDVPCLKMLFLLLQTRGRWATNDWLW